MQEYKGKIMSKSEFLKNGEFGKEEYEGLLVASDTQKGIYNIGVELGEDKILLIEQADDSNVHERYHALIPKTGNSTSVRSWNDPTNFIRS